LVVTPHSKPVNLNLCRLGVLDSEGEGAAFFIQGGDYAADLGGVQDFVLPAQELQRFLTELRR
jgi:hypothetical protein